MDRQKDHGVPIHHLNCGSLTADIQLYMQAPIYQSPVCNAKIIRVYLQQKMPAYHNVTSTKVSNIQAHQHQTQSI